MRHQTQLTQKLEIQFPIIQAPMAGASSHPHLTASVSNAGALGSFGAGYLPGDQIRKVIQKIRKETDRPFNLNLFVPSDYNEDPLKKEASLTLMSSYFEGLGLDPINPHDYAPSFEEQMAVVIEEKVPVFSFTFGIPESHYLEKLKANGTWMIGTATHLQEALELENRGVDFITLQGSEAGGHRGTFLGREEDALIPIRELAFEVKSKLATPCIAAGGIMEGRGIQEALEWGVCGVQMGTAFLTAKECPIHPKYREILLNQDQDNTALTRAFSGRLARSIRNRFLDEMEEWKDQIPDYPIQNALTQPLRQAAAQQNQPELMSLWAGQKAMLCQDKSVADLIEEWISEP